MIYTTHILFALLMMLSLSFYLHFPFSAESLLVVILGSLAPDLDHPSSYINKKGWRLFSLSALTTHRGWTHSLIGAGALTFAFFLIARSSPFAPFYSLFFFGYVSHLLIDSLNPSGVAWLWPKKKRYSLNFVKTGSLGEILFQLVLVGLILIFACHYYHFDYYNLLE
ncbi:MAG: metal-dependent hydrolase [Archaeoglobus sp.]|nr:metal-dependent hydrolase [Archaeoglobus sp.]